MVVLSASHVAARHFLTEKVLTVFSLAPPKRKVARGGEGNQKYKKVKIPNLSHFAQTAVEAQKPVNS